MRVYVNKIKSVPFLLVISFICILFLGMFLYGRTYAFNSVRHTIGADDLVRYQVYGRGGISDTWTKESIYGYKITGKIFDITISNYSDYQITNWEARIDITNDCWINNAWNGEVEIHQNVNGDEKVQTLNLLHLTRGQEIELEHYYDSGEVMINLYKGDYVIYHPSKEVYEDPIYSKKGRQTVGIIFYTVSPHVMNLSTRHATVSYNYNIELEKEPIFTVYVVLSIIWLIAFTAYLCREISLHKKREYLNQVALAEALESARRANEAKSAFLATVSHEIRTPINAMLGMNTMILRESEQEEIRRYAKEISASGHTLLSLVNDILDLSKIESGKMEIIPEEYDFAEIIKNAIDMVKPKAIEKKLDLFVDIDKRIPSKLYGDEVRIKQIILNILNNAVKYTKRGSVTLKAGVEFINDEKIVLKIAVKDTGIGIKEADIDKLFSKYERIEEEKNRNIEGTGLGLNITNKLLDLMGSKLEVESEYGKGSEFSFELIQKVISFEPVGKINFIDSAIPVEETKEKFHAPTARILVIDDVKMNLVVFKSLLKRIKCQVDTCESGREGLALAIRNRYDMIFIDHMMPNMNGIDTFHLIQEESEVNKDTPIIVLTANVIAGAREQYLEEGFTDYLSKPVDGEALEEMVMKYLSDSKIEDCSEPETDEEKRLKFLNIDDLDVDEGIKNSGSQSVYEKILKIFAESSVEEDEHIREYADNLDYENYIVEAHGIKSSAKTIGAKRLASIAFELEMAGKLRDNKKIQEGTQKLIEEHKRLARDIENVG